MEGGGNLVCDNRPLITSDSMRAYWPVFIAADADPFPYSYVYALAIEKAPPTTPGDLDTDGAVGPADLGLLLSLWGSCADPADCPADLDGDGLVDGADLAIVLANWS